MIDVQLGGQMVAVQVYNTTLGGVRSLVEADLAVDVDARAAKAANLRDLTDPLIARDAIGINVPQPQTQAFWAAVRGDQRDVPIFVCSDSTGNAEDEWVYLMSEWLGEQVSTHSVVYRVWNADESVWGSEQPLSVGTGDHTIYVDNFAIPGATAFNMEGAIERVIFDGSRDYQLVIINYGHNYGSTTTEAQNTPSFIGQIGTLGVLAPSAGILVTLQNPRIDEPDGPSNSANMVAAWLRAALLTGCGLIDVYHAFLRSPDFDIPPGTDGSLYLDDGLGVHPSPAGTAIWLEQVKAAFAEDLTWTKVSGMSPSPFLVARPNFIRNPVFQEWDAGADGPTHWTLSNCTATRETGATEGPGYALRLVTTGNNPLLSQDLTGLLPRLAGKYVTAVARVRRDADMGSETPGRLSLAGNNGSVAFDYTSFPRSRTLANEGFLWAVATVLVPADATTFALSLYPGSATGDTGKGIVAQSVSLFEGYLPGAIDYTSIPEKVADQYFSALNVGPNPANTGTITVSGNDITVTGSPVGETGVAINLKGLEAGRRYRLDRTYVSDTAGSGGGIQLRQGYDGGTATLNPATGAIDPSATVGTLHTSDPMYFNAPVVACSLLAYAFSAATGWVVHDWNIRPWFSGMSTAVPVPLRSLFNDDNTPVDGVGGSGKFNLNGLPGTSLYLETQAASSSTATAVALCEVVVPDDYRAGRPLFVQVNALYDGAGTVAVRTIDVEAWKMLSDGSASADLCGTTAQTISDTAADYAFTLDGADLAPAARLQLRITLAVQETAAGSLTGQVNAIALS